MSSLEAAREDVAVQFIRQKPELGLFREVIAKGGRFGWLVVLGLTAL